MSIETNTEAALAKVYPDVAVRWRRVKNEIWESYRLQLRVTSGLRDDADQWDLFRRGRTKAADGSWSISDPKLVVTHAKPGDSFHKYGLALDSCFVGMDPYLTAMSPTEAEMIWNHFGKLVEAYGMQWGGDWNGDGIHDKADFDRPHCQLAYGLGLSEIKSLHEHGGVAAVWAKCDQIIKCGGFFQ